MNLESTCQMGPIKSLLYFLKGRTLIFYLVALHALEISVYMIDLE